MIVVLKRYEIPCDGKPHLFDLCYPPVYAMNGTLKDELWFFAEETSEVLTASVTLMVVSDGEPWPDGALHHCVVPKPQAGQVWVLIQLAGPDDPAWGEDTEQSVKLPDPFGSDAW